MNGRTKQIVYTVITGSLYLLFLYFIIFTIAIPVFRLVIFKQKDAFDLNLLTISGAIVGFFSMILAIIFQVLSSESSKRVETAVNNIDSTLTSVKTLAECIDHKQDVINARAAGPSSAMSSQMPDKTWTVDSSK